MDVAIRRLGPDDARRYRELKLALDRETEFMLFEPGERREAEELVRRRLTAEAEGGSRSYTVGAVAREGRVLGYCAVGVPPMQRLRRTGHVVVGVLAEASGRGLGGRLLEAAAGRARETGLLRLELTVMEHNLRAMGLYLRHGYLVEGHRRAALDVGGRRVGEYHMGLLLDGSGA